MLSNKDYEELVNLVIKHFKGKKFNEMYLDIIEDIEDLNESAIKCSNKEKSFSSVMYQVKFLKSQYVEELKGTIQIYNDLIFKDFTLRE